jgi:hypothetical protein
MNDPAFEELWNGHAWALRMHADKIGPMSEQYDGYSALADMKALKEIIRHAEWLQSNLRPQEDEQKIKERLEANQKWVREWLDVTQRKS